MAAVSPPAASETPASLHGSADAVPPPCTPEAAVKNSGLAFGSQFLVPAVWALPILATLALCAGLWAGRAFLIPIFTAALLAVLLWPWLRRAERVLRSRAVAALAVVCALGVLTSGLTYAVVSQVSVSIEKLPTGLRLAARDVSALGTSHARSVQRTRSALEELDRSVARVTGTEPVPAAARATRQASLVASISDWVTAMLVAASKAAAGVALQAGVIGLLLFLLLCNAERFVDGLNRWCENRARSPRFCAPVMAETARQLRMLTGVTVVSNAAIGAGIAATCMAFGVPDAAMWALAGAALHFVPYAGLAVMAVLMALETYVVQGSAVAGLLAAGAVGAIGVVVGTAVPVWLQGRVAHTDGAVVFAGTVFWSVLWGAWGLVLGPLMVVLARVVFVQGQWLQATAEPVVPAAPEPAEPSPEESQAGGETGVEGEPAARPEPVVTA